MSVYKKLTSIEMSIDRNRAFMLKESAYIVGIESNALWVETMRQSTCGSCSARKGCGQRLLSTAGSESMRLRVLINNRKVGDTKAPDYHINDEVTIGVPEHTIVKNSLFIYLLPLFLMIVFSGIAHTFFNNEAISIGFGLLGLLFSAVLIRYHASVNADNPDLQPVLITHHAAAAHYFPGIIIP